MKKLSVILGLLCFWVAGYCSDLAPSREVSAKPELQKYEACIQQLVVSVEKRRLLFQRPWLWIDPKLYQMVDGVRVLLLNYKWLSAQYANRVIEVADAHLIANAAEGCLSYQAGFEKRVSLFARLFYGIAASLLTLTLGILLNIFSVVHRRVFRRKNPVGVGVHGAPLAQPKGPQDVSPEKSRSNHHQS